MVRAIVCKFARLDCGTSWGFEVWLHFQRKKRSAGEAIKLENAWFELHIALLTREDRAHSHPIFYSIVSALDSCKMSNVMRMRIHICRRLCRLKLALFSCAVLILRACSSKVIKKGWSPRSHPATSSKSVTSNNIEGTTK